MSTVEGTFEAEIDRLAALQELDRRLKVKQEQMAALIGEAEAFEQELTRQREQLASLTLERDDLEKQRAEMDGRLEVEGGKIRDSRMRLNRVRNDREMMALQREIDLGKEANHLLEEQLIEVMERLESLNQVLNEARAGLDALDGQAESEVDAKRNEAATIDRETASDREQRDLLVRGMDPALRGKYERIFARRDGTAVVEVRGGTCLGCHMNVPPQLFNELQRYRDIRQCPNCHRIMYFRPENNGSASDSKSTGA